MKTCPCGSGDLFSHCCAPNIQGQTLPLTAEALMRSRYTAYVLKDEAYLLNTWAANSRPDHLDFDGDATRWEGLSILNCEEGKEGDRQGTVEFIARYRVDGRVGQLHENSSFERAAGRWQYQRGDILPDLDFSKTGRNDVCPCGSGRKYKKCCGG